MNTLRHGLCALALLAALPCGAAAQGIVFSTFDSDPINNVGWSVNGANADGDPTSLGQGAGGFFALDRGEDLFAFELVTEHFFGENAYTLAFRQSDSAGLPGAVLTSWSVSFPEVDPAVIRVDLPSAFAAQADTRYWLTALPSLPSGDSFGTWIRSRNKTGNFGLGSSNDANWQFVNSTTVQLRVYGTPGPSALPLAALGFSGLGLILRRRVVRSVGGCGASPPPGF